MSFGPEKDLSRSLKLSSCSYTKIICKQIIRKFFLSLDEFAGDVRVVKECLERLP